MAKLININNNVKNIVSKSSIAAATAAMCINLGLSAQDAQAAKAAIADIAAEQGTGAARAVIISMEPDFGGFYA